MIRKITSFRTVGIGIGIYIGGEDGACQIYNKHLMWQIERIN